MIILTLLKIRRLKRERYRLLLQLVSELTVSLGPDSADPAIVELVCPVIERELNRRLQIVNLELRDLGVEIDG